LVLAGPSPRAVATPAIDEGVRIHLLPHDPAWTRRFCRERDRIACTLGRRARRIEHIGSTAVPGLAAKPIVDVLLTVDDIDDEPSWLPPLEAAGYQLHITEPGHRLLRRPTDDGVNLHVWAEGRDEPRDHLFFRDQLRCSARLRRAYEELKRELAEHPWPTVDHYADAKGPFIASVLASAPCSSRPR